MWRVGLRLGVGRGRCARRMRTCALRSLITPPRVPHRSRHCPLWCRVYARVPTASPGSWSPAHFVETWCQEQLFRGIHGIRWYRSGPHLPAAPGGSAPHICREGVSALWPHRRPEVPQRWAPRPSRGLCDHFQSGPKEVFADTSAPARSRLRRANTEA